MIQSYPKLLIRGTNEVTTLIFFGCARKKKINPTNSENNKKHIVFNLVDSNIIANDIH
jgi:hypothetical protein